MSEQEREPNDCSIEEITHYENWCNLLAHYSLRAPCVTLPVRLETVTLLQ